MAEIGVDDGEMGGRRGILYPAQLPQFHRESVPDDLAAQIRWFWIPQWDLSLGRRSRQHVLPFPACNLVIEPEGVSLVGPTTGASYRDLEGRGWALGALLRPAAAGMAAMALTPTPAGMARFSSIAEPNDFLAALADDELRIEDSELWQGVRDVMTHNAGPEDRARAISLCSDWFRAHWPVPDETARLANAMEDLIASDPDVTRVEHIGAHLGLSVRAVQRIARRYVGIGPLAMIRRYRLQEAAERIRSDSTVTIAEIAAALGYADHAHLTSDFRRVLGVTPTSYRMNHAAPHPSVSPSLSADHHDSR